MTIIAISKWIGSLMTIFTFLMGAYKYAKKFEQRFDDIDVHFKNLDKDLKENTLMTLKLVIMNDDLSLEERIVAGEKYISLGGNGFVKEIYNKLVERKIETMNLD
ncbi:hypothetical protein [Peptostreptococcus porci]|uniref:hypothetical protein n=1 Tax=Peptostreptococcus porci TaxID=2652282 RepID=UPI002A83EDCD|nr:hypothetical protein [Peptostreptococcus porci]MDY4127659.1 hypothetical protein [Peptostreptococcus porci]